MQFSRRPLLLRRKGQKAALHTLCRPLILRYLSHSKGSVARFESAISVDPTGTKDLHTDPAVYIYASTLIPDGRAGPTVQRDCASSEGQEPYAAFK